MVVEPANRGEPWFGCCSLGAEVLGAVIVAGLGGLIVWQGVQQIGGGGGDNVWDVIPQDGGN